MNNRRVYYFYIFAALCISLSIVWSWTGGSALIMGHDSGYRLILRPFFVSLFYAWSPAINFGVGTLFNPAVLSVHIPEVIASFVSNDHVIRQTIVLLFWHVFNLCAIVFSYQLIRPFVFKNAHWVAIVASVLYAINFLNLHAWSVLWRTKFSTQFVIPLLVFFLYRTLHEGKLHPRTLIIVAIIVAMCNGGGSPPLYGPLLLAWTLTGVFVIAVRRFAWRTIALFFKTSMSIFGMFCLLSSYWLVPYIIHASSSYSSEVQAQGGIDTILLMVDAVSKNASFLNIFRLQGLPAWDAQTVFPFMLTYMNSPVFIFISFLWLAMAISAYFWTREKHEKQFVGLIFLLMLGGALFTAGTHGSTGMLFRGAMYEIPGFAIFRTAFYKFGMIPWFAISMLGAYSLVRISEKIAHVWKRPALFLISIALFIVGVFWYHAPLLRGEFFAYNTPFTNQISIPEYVHETAAFIHVTTAPSDRILLLPRFDVDRMDGYTWGYWGPDPFPRLVINRPILSDAYSPPPIVNGLYRMLEEKRYDDFLILLRLTGVRHILWRDDALYSDKKTMGSNFQATEKALSELSGITRAASFGQWRVYTVGNIHRMPRVGVFGDSIVSDVEYEEYLRVMPQRADNENLPFVVAATNATGKSTLLGAACIVCQEVDDEYFRKKAVVADAQFSPTSKLYPLVRWWEERRLRMSHAGREESIQLIYEQLGKRLAEIQTFMYMWDSQDSAVVTEAKGRVARHLSDAREFLMGLPALAQHKIVADMQLTLLSYLFMTSEWGPHPVRDQLVAELRELRTRVPKATVSMEEMQKNQRVFVIDIPVSGMYTMHQAGRNGYRELYIDGQIVSNSSIYLSEGIHRIDVFVSDSEEENGQVYFSQPHTVVNESVPSSTVSMQSQVSYTVHIAEANTPFFVYLNDLFDPGWTATIGTSNGRNAQIAPSNHIQVNGFANAWYVQDLGSFDIHISYAPQRYIWWGMTIAAFAWVGCIIILFWPVKERT